MGQDPMRRRLVIVCLAFLLLVAGRCARRAHTACQVLRAPLRDPCRAESRRADRSRSSRLQPRDTPRSTCQCESVGCRGCSAVLHCRQRRGRCLVSGVFRRGGDRRCDGYETEPCTSCAAPMGQRIFRSRREAEPAIRRRCRSRESTFLDWPSSTETSPRTSRYSAPALTVDLSSRGRLALDAPLDLTVGSTSTRIDTLQSDISFDGRDLQLMNLAFSAPELRGSDRRHACAHQATSVDRRASGQRQ